MGSMLSLLDVLPRHERVDLGGGQAIDVFGISGEDIGRILERYPDSFQQIMEVGARPNKLDPGLMGALVAATQRNGSWQSLLGNQEVENRGRALSIGAQMKVLQAMGRCTFPDGIGPFLDGLSAMSSAATVAIELVVSAGSKDQPTVSRPKPKPSAAPVTPTSGS